MPRLLILLPRLEPGGAEHTMLRLANGLGAEFDIQFAVVQHRGELLRNSGFTVHRLGGRLALFLTLPWLVWRLRPAVVLSTIWDLNLLVSGLRFAFPRATSVIVREPTRPAALSARPWWWRLGMGLHGLCYARANCIVAPSQQIARELLDQLRLPPQKVATILNGVAPDRLLPCDQLDRPFVGDRPRLVAVGRLGPEKGYDLLIDSLPMLQAADSGVELHLVGDGPERERLAALAAARGVASRVHLHGWLDDPRPLLATADLFIMCSRYEGLSNAMIEALCNGLPVVAMRRQTGAEEVIEPGRNGVLVEDTTAIALAAGIDRALADHARFDRREIAHQARARFSHAAWLEHWRELLTQQSAG